MGYDERAAHRPQRQVSTAEGGLTADPTPEQAVKSVEVVLHAFENDQPKGREPEAGLVGDAAGNLYGSTYGGGPNGAGVVFKVDRSGNISVVYAFKGGADGRSPTGDLILDQAGNLYGTAVFGGDSVACPAANSLPGCGVVFKVDRFGKETVLYSFKGGASGAYPYVGGLTLDNTGNLYGITLFGGDTSVCSGAGCGVVFKLDKSGKETVLHTFTGGADGAEPNGSLLLDNAGNLYGTARYGGLLSACHNQTQENRDGCGVVFKLDKSGNETVLHTFTGGADGALPFASLTVDRAGNLYGAASSGGASGCSGKGCGVVFKLDQTSKETVLYSFTGMADGGRPNATLLFDGSGNLYSSATRGGDLSGCSGTGCGVVFKLDKFGNETVLHAFTGGADGAFPNRGLVRDNAGNLYGTTTQGGRPNFGAVYKLDPDRFKTEYTVYALPSSIGGSLPFDGLTFDGAGNLYGTTSGGGPFAAGVVFKLDKYGKKTVLHTFTRGTDGGHPQAGVIVDNAGNVYGTANDGGDLSGCSGFGCGVVFKLDQSGKETVLYTFKGGADGANPFGGLSGDNAGNFYGTASAGGNLSACSGSGCGVVFKLDKSGKESALYTFNGGADGAFPYVGNLTLDNAGNLYGAAYTGGDLSGCFGSGCGVVFKLDQSGKETVLYTFKGGADGANPNAGLKLDNAGNLYGTAFDGGDLTICSGNGCGIVFKLDQSGMETVLYTFKGSADGSSPNAGVIADNAGNLYGTASTGGDLSACSGNGCGVVFKLDKSGKENLLYAFKGVADGANPEAGLIFDNAGNLYSTAFSGGQYGGGVVFKILQH